MAAYLRATVQSDCARTSPATLSNYETATKEPRAGTLERLLAAAGHELDTRPARTANERRTDLICEALAERVLADPGLLEAARERLDMLRRVHDDGSAERWLSAWGHLLDADAEAVAAVLTSSAGSAPTEVHHSGRQGARAGPEWRHGEVNREVWLNSRGS